MSFISILIVLCAVLSLAFIIVAAVIENLVGVIFGLFSLILSIIGFFNQKEKTNNEYTRAFHVFYVVDTVYNEYHNFVAFTKGKYPEYNNLDSFAATNSKTSRKHVFLTSIQEISVTEAETYLGCYDKTNYTTGLPCKR